jgi:glycosyltransferase involved in cell wall biosynthesis
MVKKVLVISPTPSHPQNAGNRARVYSLLSNIEEMGHEVYFLHIKREMGDERAMRACWGRRFFPVAYTDPQSSTIKKRLSRRVRRGLVRRFFLRSPASRVHDGRVDDWYDKSLDEHLIDLSKKIGFDVVIVEYVFFSRSLDLFGGDVLKVVDTIDVFSHRHKSMVTSGLRPIWFSTTPEQEALGLSRADVVIAISEADREFFSKLVDRSVITVGHIVPLYERARHSSGTSDILFVASGNLMNVQGIRHFIETVFPQVRAQCPGVQLLLAGAVCEQLGDYEGCIKLGQVRDIQPIYEMVRLVVAPMLFGTGLSIKTVEALARSKPVVTTSSGCRGLEEAAGEAFLVADTPEEFASCVVRVLTDSELSESLARSAYDFAVQWNRRHISALEDILNS